MSSSTITPKLMPTIIRKRISVSSCYSNPNNLFHHERESSLSSWGTAPLSHLSKAVLGCFRGSHQGCESCSRSGGVFSTPSTPPEAVSGDSRGSGRASKAGGTRSRAAASNLLFSRLTSRSRATCSRRCSISLAMCSIREARKFSSTRPSTRRPSPSTRSASASTGSSTHTYRNPSSPVSESSVPRFARFLTASVVVPKISAASFRSTRLRTRLPSVYPASTRSLTHPRRRGPGRIRAKTTSWGRARLRYKCDVLFEGHTRCAGVGSPSQHHSPVLSLFRTQRHAEQGVLQAPEWPAGAPPPCGPPLIEGIDGKQRLRPIQDLDFFRKALFDVPSPRSIGVLMNNFVP